MSHAMPFNANPLKKKHFLCPSDIVVKNRAKCLLVIGLKSSNVCQLTVHIFIIGSGLNQLSASEVHNIKFLTIVMMHFVVGIQIMLNHAHMIS